jgi:hypothetical protein
VIACTRLRSAHATHAKYRGPWAVDLVPVALMDGILMAEWRRLLVLGSKAGVGLRPFWGPEAYCFLQVATVSGVHTSKPMVIGSSTDFP